MSDELAFLNTLVAQLGGQGLVFGIIALILWKKGILKNVLNGNGHGGIDDVKKELVELRDNHMHELSEKLEKLMELERTGNLNVEKILWLIKEKIEKN